MGRYMRERYRFDSPETCLDYIITVCAHIAADTIRASFTGIGWERKYVESLRQTVEKADKAAGRAPIDLVRQAAKPEDVLAKLVDAEKVADDNLRYYGEALLENPGDTDLQAGWAAAFKAWGAAVQSRQETADIVRRQELEVANTPQWQKRHAEVLKQLHKQYEGHGIQYELVCAAVADAAIQLERMRTSERQAHPKEVEVWHKNLMAGVRRLQTYTESAKVETTSRVVNEVMNDVLLIMERIIRPQQPLLWQAGAKAVREYIAEKRTA